MPEQLELKIVISGKKDSTKKKQLLAVIARKRVQLKTVVTKVEMLRVNLEVARQEYMVKVGSLFLKDNHLDLEIIRCRNILRLLNEGLTYDEAVTKIEHTFYNEQLEIEKEQEKIRIEEEQFKKRVEKAPEIMVDIKKVWKKLIAKFHPDLVQDLEEKKRRDTIMKMINKAYQESDLETLTKIEQDHLPTHENTVDTLEDILIRLMNDIIVQHEEYKSLKESEWYDWMEKIAKAKRQNKDIFADTERMLLNDIVAKYDILNELKGMITEKQEAVIK